MDNDNIKQLITDTIGRIEYDLEVLDDINKASEELVALLQTEMKNQLVEIKYNNGKKNPKLKQKPWWNENLQQLWRLVCEQEQCYLRCKDRGRYRKELKLEYVQSRKEFDRVLRRTKRRYQQQQQEDIQILAETDIVGFWRKINMLSIGGQRDSLIPMAVEDNGTLVTDIETVMERWKNDFSSLYSSPTNEFDNDHLQQVESQMKEIERIQAALPLDDDTNSMNNPLTLDEVTKAVYGLRNHKASGIDSIPAECLKNGPVINLLFKIYSYCFQKSIVPDYWLKGIIHPIFKQGSLYNPLNTGVLP